MGVEKLRGWEEVREEKNLKGWEFGGMGECEENERVEEMGIFVGVGAKTRWWEGKGKGRGVVLWSKWRPKMEEGLKILRCASMAEYGVTGVRSKSNAEAVTVTVALCFLRPY